METGVVEAIYEDAVGLVGRINGGLVRASAEQGERDADDDALLVGAWTDLDHIVSGGVIDCGLDTGITPAGAGGVDAMSGSNSREGERCRQRNSPTSERQKSQTNGERGHGHLLCECSDSVITSGGSQGVKSSRVKSSRRLPGSLFEELAESTVLSSLSTMSQVSPVWFRYLIGPSV